MVVERIHDKFQPEFEHLLTHGKISMLTHGKISMAEIVKAADGDMLREMDPAFYEKNIRTQMNTSP